MTRSKFTNHQLTDKEETQVNPFALLEDDIDEDNMYILGYTIEEIEDEILGETIEENTLINEVEILV